MEIINKKYNKKTKSRKMLEKTNNEEFFILPKSFQKNDMNRCAKDSENNIITMSGCKHSSSIENLMEQFVDNFTFLVSKRHIRKRF